MTSGLKGQLAKWPEYRLRFLLEKTRSVDEFRRLERVREVSFIPMENIGEKGEIDTSQVKLKGEVSNGYTLFFEGDVLVAKITPCFENGKGAVARELIGGIGFGTTELYVLDPGAKLHEQFLYYITVSEHFRKLGEASMKGAAGQKRVPDEFIQDYRFRLPPLETQRRIADYLDRETARIDALIAEKEKMLALLEEKRTALISRAVTRGLNPDAPMKPSGLDWLGDIPAHWEIRALKRASAAIDTGSTPSASYMDGTSPSDFIWFTPGDFENGRVLNDSKRKIPVEAIENREAKVFPANSVMVIGIGATLGKVAISPVEFSANQQINVIYPSEETCPNYLLFVLQSYEKVLQAHANSATLPILNQERLGAIRIPFPPKDEQIAIADIINAEELGENELENELRSSIGLLKERRVALITATVTGQVGWKGIAA